MIADLIGCVVLLLLAGMFVLFMAPVGLLFFWLNKRLYNNQRQERQQKND